MCNALSNLYKKSETLKLPSTNFKGHATRDKQSAREREREEERKTTTNVVARHASRGAHSELANALDHGIFDDVVFIVLARGGRRQW